MRFEDTRRTARVGFLLRSFFRFYAQIPRLRPVEIETATDHAAPGIIADVPDLQE